MLAFHGINKGKETMLSHFTFRGKLYKRLSRRCFTRVRRILFRHPCGGIVGKQDIEFLYALIDNRKFCLDIDRILVIVNDKSQKRSFSIVREDNSVNDFHISLFLESLSQQDRNIKYNEYLLSDAWQFKRLQIFERDGWVCVYCQVRASHVHHKTYKNLGNEPLSDLENVCRSCHQKIHGKTFSRGR